MKYFFLIGFFGVILVLALGLKDDPKIIPSNLLSKDIPDFNLEKMGNFSFLKNEQILLEKSTPKIVNFFASWCPPCQYEHKYLMELSKKFVIYGIAKKDDFSKINLWFSKDGNPFEKIGHDVSPERNPPTELFPRRRGCDLAGFRRWIQCGQDEGSKKTPERPGHLSLGVHFHDASLEKAPERHHHDHRSRSNLQKRPGRSCPGSVLLPDERITRSGNRKRHALSEWTKPRPADWRSGGAHFGIQYA